MNNEIKLIFLSFSLGFIFFTCKSEPELKYDYRDELVGTYLCVCTRTHTGPWHPGFVSTTDTTAIDVEKEISFDSTDELNENGSGFIKINGGTYSISPKDDEGEYRFGGPPAHLGYNRGVIYGTPDSMFFSHVWSGSPSNNAEYSYGCRGHRIQ